MTQVLIINGSPRKKGNTSFLAEKLTSKLNQDAVIVNSIFLEEKNIRGCSDCRACKQGKFVCNVPDDMRHIYPEMEISDIIIVGTPIYWYGPTAQCKSWLDRLRPYFGGKKKLKDKKLALLLPAGSGSSDCDLTIEMFKRACKALEMDYFGEVCSEAYNIGDSKNDQNALVQINTLAQKINSL